LKEFHTSERNIAIDDEVIHFIANELKLSIREMIGAFNRIAAYLNINNRKISVAEAKGILRDSLNRIETNITIEDIQKTVVSYYNISMHDFMSSRRSRSVARPRQIAMYLSKKMTTKSLPDIGRRFSGRDHTTVIHAIKKVEELMIQDKNFENEVKDLNQKLTKTV
jgi:chromosomal replication initiator protein